MKSDDVTPDSCNVWMRALAASSDISGVERVYEEMKRDVNLRREATKVLMLISSSHCMGALNCWKFSEFGAG
ncbi:hypothetical protein MKW98_017012 [Papaver atlanticum]|uniref:Pentatricopeptide repeat-containing protein n=1 Tax=Papaver atlanticum TaxID=357466 RepID=A0AAD4TK74_9MAGN|nr:hypothetical protein MKW98_017012 [Papaver atlanticum]